MLRRRLLLWAATPALLGVVGCWTGLLVSRPSVGITRQNYEWIRQGMTRQEVEAVLGGPAGDYSRQRVPARFPAPLRGGGSGKNMPDGTLECWRGEELSIAILFTPDGRVAWKDWEEYELPPLLCRLRSLLPW
jgi:hypothetical protein